MNRALVFGSYWPGTVLGREEGLTRYNDDESPLVHVRVIRPIPPGYRNFELNDIVDAYNYDVGAWKAGIVIGNVENLDHHLVRLFDQTERFHAEWFPLPCCVFWRQSDEYTYNYDVGAWQAGTVIGNVEHHLVRLFHAEWFPLPCYVFWRPTDEYTGHQLIAPQIKQIDILPNSGDQAN